MAKSARSPAFQFYPNDWLSSVRVAAMTPAQEGAYLRLLCYAWMNEDCGIPDDDEALSRLSRMGEGWFNGGSQIVRLCFTSHPTKNGMLCNMRLMEEREKQRAWREKSKAGGVKSGRSRRSGTKGGSQMVATKREPKVNSPSPSPSPFPIKGDVSPFNPLFAPLPVELDSDEFKAAWASWVEHRKQIKKRLTELAVTKQLKELAAMGTPRAVAAINHSIANGWTGIFPAKDNANGKRTGDNPQRFDEPTAGTWAGKKR